jgi:hypothetical protein
MSFLSTPAWDPSQFQVQSDGTFRISIRGMAAMAGVDYSSFARSLRSAVAENALPCARSLLAQGFDPVAVSTWGETGGIPEDAAPFILEHYGITASSPSDQARAVLLAFSRVGINAYLKERLGIAANTGNKPALPEAAQRLDWLMGFCTRWDIRLDERDMLHIKEHAQALALPPAGQGQSVFNDYPISRLVMDIANVTLKSKQLIAIGRVLASMWRKQKGSDPKKHDQYVDGACRSVAHYPREWAEPAIRELMTTNPDMFRR